MATLAMIPVVNARSLLYERGGGGLRAIYRQAGLPPPLFRAFRVAVSAILDGHPKSGPAAFAARIIEQLMLVYDDLSPASLEGMFAQLSSQAMPRDASAAQMRAARQ
jgi:hypothetical protein